MGEIMRRDTEAGRFLAAGGDRVQAQDVSSDQKPRTLRHSSAWAWPFPPRDPDVQRYEVGNWGKISFRPASEDLPADVMIHFDNGSLDARQEAFRFAQALMARLRGDHPELRINFISAEDHYHVLVEQFINQEHKIATGIYESFATRGLLSGKRSGRSTFTHEQQHAISEEWPRRRG